MNTCMSESVLEYNIIHYMYIIVKHTNIVKYTISLNNIHVHVVTNYQLILTLIRECSGNL